MTPDRFRIVRDLFDRACELPIADRRAFLETACAGDPELRTEVERLLASEAHPAGVLENSPLTQAFEMAWNATTHSMPEQIGPYRLIAQIGQGGMGSVYEARQANPERSVAIKVMRADHASPEALRRFVHEAHVLGRLSHPGIAHIYESGIAQTPDGPRPFIAMELIRGSPLIAHATSAGLGVVQRIELFAKVCEAVEHAHQCGVVHRDLKPSNILVNDAGGPKIVDFGVAAASGGEHASMHTRAGQVIGTLSYMSPEQITGGANQVGRRSDIYSLGVLLFELLTGRLPLDLRERSLPESARIVRDEEPSRLSAIDTSLRGDLDTIVTKCLEKEPGRRYSSAGSLAEDLRRFLADEPILARPPTTVYQLAKFARRHRELVVGVVAAFIILIGGIIATSWVAVRAQRERVIAQRNEALARWESYRNAISAAERAFQVNDTANGLRTLQSAPAEHRGWEWRHLMAASDESLRTIRAHEGAVTGLAISVADDALYSTGSDGMLCRWSVLTGKQIWSRKAHDTSVVLLLAGEVIITQGGDGAINAWIAGDGSPLWSMDAGKASKLHPQALSADGTRLAVPMGSRVAFLDARKGVEVGELALPLAGPTNVAISADGTRLSCTLRGQAVVFDLATGSEVARTLAEPVMWAGVDGSLWHFSGGPRRLLHFRLQEGATMGSVGVIDNVAGAVPVASRDMLVALARPGGVFFADPRDHVAGSPRTMRLRGPAESLTAAAYEREHSRIVTGDQQGMVRLWTSTPRATNLSGGGSNDSAQSCAISPEGELFVTGGWGGIKFWNARTGDELRTVFPLRREVLQLVFDRTGSRLFAFGRDGRVVSLEAATGRTLMASASIAPVANLMGLAWSEPAKVLLTVSDSDTVSAFDPETGDFRGTHVFEGAMLVDIVASPTDKLAAVGDRAGRVWLLSLDNLGAPPIQLVAWGSHGVASRRAPTLTFSPDGKHLAAILIDNTINLLDVATREPVWNRPNFGMSVLTDLVFSTDASRLFISTEDGAVGVIDTLTGDKLLTLRDESHTNSGIAFANEMLIAVSNTPRPAWRAFMTQPAGETIESHERRARTSEFATRLIAEHRLVAKAIAALDADVSVSDPDRAAVKALLLARGDHPNYLNNDAWAIVRFPNRTPAEYALALELSRRGCELRPDSFAFANTLGFAYFRVAEFDNAERELLRALRLRKDQGASEDPTDLFALAMVRRAMGNAQQSNTDFDRANELMTLPAFRDDSESQWIRAEARKVLGRP